MPLNSITLHGYRGFARSQSLRLAVPSGSEGSGLTIRIGPNNGGKSSLIEALSFLRLPGHPFEMDDAQRNSDRSGRVNIAYHLEAGVYELAAFGSDLAKWAGVPEPSPRGIVYTLPSRRHIESSFSTVRFSESSRARRDAQ